MGNTQTVGSSYNPAGITIVRGQLRYYFMMDDIEADGLTDNYATIFNFLSALPYGGIGMAPPGMVAISQTLNPPNGTIYSGPMPMGGPTSNQIDHGHGSWLVPTIGFVSDSYNETSMTSTETAFTTNPNTLTVSNIFGIGNQFPNAGTLNVPQSPSGNNTVTYTTLTVASNTFNGCQNLGTPLGGGTITLIGALTTALVHLSTNNSGIMNTGMYANVGVSNQCKECVFPDAIGNIIQDCAMDASTTTNTFSVDTSQLVTGGNPNCQNLEWTGGIANCTIFAYGSDWLVKAIRKTAGQVYIARSSLKWSGCYFTTGLPPITCFTSTNFEGCTFDGANNSTTAFIVINAAGATGEVTFSKGTRFFLPNANAGGIPLILHTNTNDCPVSLDGTLDAKLSVGGNPAPFSCIISNPVAGDIVTSGFNISGNAIGVGQVSSLAGGSTTLTLAASNPVPNLAASGSIAIPLAGGGWYTGTYTTTVGSTTVTLTTAFPSYLTAATGASAIAYNVLYITGASGLKGPTHGGQITLNGLRFPGPGMTNGLFTFTSAQVGVSSTFGANQTVPLPTNIGLDRLLPLTIGWSPGAGSIGGENITLKFIVTFDDATTATQTGPAVAGTGSATLSQVLAPGLLTKNGRAITGLQVAATTSAASTAATPVVSFAFAPLA